MANRRTFHWRPGLDVLEPRLALSSLTPANVIGTSLGNVASPHAVSTTSAVVKPRNITPGKHGMIFGLFVQPTPNSLLNPRIQAATGNQGQPLPLEHGRAFRPGVHADTVAFTTSSQPGLLTTAVTGLDQTTGAYTAQTTLVGDINGDGEVNLADVQAFAKTYMSRRGGVNYNPAADFNHNGVINLYDAKALLHNVAPSSPSLPLNSVLLLAPQDQIHYSGPTVSGAATFKKVVTIVGRTTPGSLVIEDNHTARLPGGTQAYKFTGPAHAADAQGFFSVVTTNTEGLNNNNFLILDPFGHQLIRSFPIYWISFATGRST
jgi:Dockerin type I domain